MINNSKSLLALAALVLFMSFTLASGETKGTEEIAIKSTVIDPFCLITMDMKGEEHREGALECAKAGMNLAIMDEKGKIYPVLPEKAVANPNQPLLDYVEKTVTVSGTLFEGRGVSYIMVKEVKSS